MAKKTTGNTQKITFGVKKKNKAKRAFGPKEQKPKKYRGQGR